MSSLPLVSATLPTRAKGSVITEAQLPSKKANRSCSPNQQRGSTAAPGSSGLPSPPTWLAPGLALVPSPASLGQTNNHHLHSQTSSEAGRAGATSTVWRGTWPNWICFITPYNDSQTGLFQWSKIKDYKKYLPACHSEFGPKWAAPPKQMGRHLKNVLCLWGHVVFPIII